jgi:hypothetical protein
VIVLVTSLIDRRPVDALLCIVSELAGGFVEHFDDEELCTVGDDGCAGRCE